MAQKTHQALNAVIFAGAGASKSVNAERYPTTIEFFARLPEEIRNDRLFQMVEQYLRRSDAERILDIEEVLWELQSLRTFAREQQVEETFVGHALRKSRLARILQGQNHNFNHLDSILGEVSGYLDTLIGSINAAVYDFYDYEPSEEELVGNWLYLLKEIDNAGWKADIFTTNYDVAIETAISIEGATPYDQFVGLSGRTRKRLDLRRWMDAESSDRLLTKLHGSIDWQYRNTDIYVGSPVYTGDHKKQAIIYPGFKGESDSEFFRVMHDYLGRRLEEADVCLFVGFAFRDEYVNRLIRERMRQSSRLVVLNPAKKLSLPRDRTHFHVKQPFNQAAVDRAIYG